MSSLFWERFYNRCLLKGTKPNPVAKEINISSGIVTKWKNDGTLPNGETLLRLADHLDCSVDYLLGRTDELWPEGTAPLSEKQKTVLNLAEQFSEEDIKRLIDYAELLRKADNRQD